ncbi:uncharacterized protein LOC128210205 isoform X2 [Mya arenaria]|uniref:uncharacterized protein LOC128210205 isoform X2 n=1 Tax=Mya arenaria TaxID=6604 RepID=UPI0022E38E81|nr:uncharacterized protein LOC128210205 isoform X2 [Mya arenaria]
MEHFVIVHVNGDEETVCLNMEKLMKLNYLLKYPDFLEQICKTFQPSYILKIERSETEIIFPCSKDKTNASKLLENILSKANLVYTELPVNGLCEDTVKEQLKLSQVDTKVHWIVDSNQSKVLIVCHRSDEVKAARYVSESIKAAKSNNKSLEMPLCVKQMFEKELEDTFQKDFPNIQYKWSPVGEYRCSMTLDGRHRNEAVKWIEFECVNSVGRVSFEHIMSGCSVDAIHKLIETLHVNQGKHTIYWDIIEKEKNVLFCSLAGAPAVSHIEKRLRNSIVQKSFDLPEKLSDERVQTLLQFILSELKSKFEYIVGEPFVTEQSDACSSLQFSFFKKDQKGLEPEIKCLLGKYRAVEVTRCFDHNPVKCSYFKIEANRGKIEKKFHTVLKHNCSFKGKCKIQIIGEKNDVDCCTSYIDKLTKQHIVCHMEGPDSTKVIGKIENACHENYVAYEVEHVGNKYPPSPKSPLMVDHKCWLFPNRSQLTVTKLSLDDCPAELKVTTKEQESTSPPNQTFCQIGEGSAVLNIPKWESGKEKYKLSQAFKSILDAAEKEETYNIAVAVIPTSWQSHKHMKIIFNTFDNYVKKRSAMDPSINMTFCCSIEGTFEDCIGMFNKAAEKLKCTSQSITEKMEIVINSGSFAHVAAEVLVNSANVNLKMKEGKISSLILMREGEDLQSTISNEHPRALKTEEVYATKGKSCKWIFHIALPPKSDPNYMEVLNTLVFNSLCEAENKRCVSIAFPALGIGKTLQYELKEVAQSMLSVAEKFQRERRPLYLKKMQIVIFQEDQSVEFKKVQQSIQEKKKPKDISRTLFFGRARVHGEYGTLDNVDSQVLVYLWEKDEIKRESADLHPLVSRLDSKDKSLWKTFNKAIQSATFFFNSMHALLVIEKFQVADTILTEIMNSMDMSKSDCSLIILTEGMHNKSHLFGYIQNLEPVDLAGKNCVVLDVFGEDSCVNQLISTVKQLQGISKVEPHKN